jgi:fermentation-respiration switch protein FrsA (DUF1100 family)
MSAEPFQPEFPEPRLPAPAKRPYVRLTRTLGIAGGLLVAAYAAQVGMLYSGQERLLFPGACTQGKSRVQVPEDAELVYFDTRSGERVAALFGGALRADGAPDSEAYQRPTLLYFYGNGTCMGTSLPQFELFRRAGANVLIAEYVGYGQSTGKATETGCYETADAAYDYLCTRSDVDAHRIVAGGGSLGGAVAIDLAARKPVVGLITFMTFTSLTEVARKHFPLVPVEPLMRFKFDSLTKIREVRCPALLVHGKRDILVPVGMMDRLASALPTAATQIVVPTAAHPDLFSKGAVPISKAVRQFLTEL